MLGVRGGDISDLHSYHRDGQARTANYISVQFGEGFQGVSTLKLKPSS